MIPASKYRDPPTFHGIRASVADPTAKLIARCSRVDFHCNGIEADPNKVAAQVDSALIVGVGSDKKIPGNELFISTDQDRKSIYYVHALDTPGSCLVSKKLQGEVNFLYMAMRDEGRIGL